MKRLESIKERLKVITHDYVDGQLTDDIEYLLQRLERYETALQKISVPMPGSRDNELVLYYERIAEEALKEENRGGLLNPDGGDYPLKWMTEPKE